MGIAPLEIEEAQKRWADAMVRVGKLHRDGSSGWLEAAEQYIDSDLGFQKGPVLLRPISAAEGPFRTTRAGVLSYLVGNNQEFPGDLGFWLQGWTEVRFENAGIASQGEEGMVNGRCYLNDTAGRQALVDYSFGFFRDSNDSLRINVMFLAAPFEGQNRTTYAGITQDDIIAAQASWADAILEIGHHYASGQDYKRRADDFVDSSYAFGVSRVWFKPTEALEKPFRDTREGALSYLVGGSEDFPEDHGFALWPWSSIHFTNAGYILEMDRAWAIGTAVFQDKDGDNTVAQYAFGYMRDAEGALRINLHHSAKPKNAHVQHGNWQLADDSKALSSIEEAQRAWSKGIVRLGTLHSIHGDYETAGAQFVDSLYAFSIRPVLFRPAELEEHPYRHTRDGAISYFVGGDPRYLEDKGFALEDWRSVHFSSAGTLYQGDESITMGSVAFEGNGGVQTEADYVFGYVQDSTGRLRVNLFQTSYPEQTEPAPGNFMPITQEDIQQAQQRWADGIVDIGETYTNNSDYMTKAERFVDDLYGYDMIPVLMRATDSNLGHIRLTREGAISYFVGRGDEESTSDAGLALQPWARVRFENLGSNIIGERAEVVGHCFLVDAQGTEHKMEYSFVYWRDAQDSLRIILCFLSWPYDAEDGWWLTDAAEGVSEALHTAGFIFKGPVGLGITVFLVGACIFAAVSNICRRSKAGSGWDRPRMVHQHEVELAPLMHHQEVSHIPAHRFLPVQSAAGYPTQLTNAYVTGPTGMPSLAAVPHRMA